jgi:hypothetical protein
MKPLSIGHGPEGLRRPVPRTRMHSAALYTCSGLPSTEIGKWATEGVPYAVAVKNTAP